MCEGQDPCSLDTGSAISVNEWSAMWLICHRLCSDQLDNHFNKDRGCSATFYQFACKMCAAVCKMLAMNVNLTSISPLKFAPCFGTLFKLIRLCPNVRDVIISNKKWRQSWVVSQLTLVSCDCHFAKHCTLCVWCGSKHSSILDTPLTCVTSPAQRTATSSPCPCSTAWHTYLRHSRQYCNTGMVH